MTSPSRNETATTLSGRNRIRSRPVGPERRTLNEAKRLSVPGGVPSPGVSAAAPILLNRPAMAGFKTNARRKSGGLRAAAAPALAALASTLAAAATGGLAGPFPLLLLAPALVAFEVGRSRRTGVIFSLLAVALTAGLQRLGRVLPAPDEPSRSLLTLSAALIGAVALGGLLGLARDRRRSAEADADAGRALLRSAPGGRDALLLTCSDTGEVLSLDPGAGSGALAAALTGSLPERIALEDRPAAYAALQEVRAGRGGVLKARLADMAGAVVEIHLQPRAGGGAVALVLPPPAPPAAPIGALDPFPNPAPTRALTERLARAESALAVAAAALERADAARREAEASAEARGRFLANMSHELRTPLNAIMGFSDVMRVKMFGELQPKYAEYAELIHSSGAHLLALINDVLDISKIEAQRYTLQRETFDVREALNDALRLVRQQADDAGVKLRAILPRGALPVDADKRALKQIVINLLSNALKFTPSGGVVILTARVFSGALEIVVADTGVGIAPEDLERLGRPFEQAGDAGDRARGSGLGLSLVTSLAELHGGALSLESRVGEGTAATVRLPVVNNPRGPGPTEGSAG